jgi:SAM-dependent methyltransferase
LTGERPQEGVTPDSLLALHDAGYQAIVARLGPGRLLDVGCGQGFESARFLAPERAVVGVDYSSEATGSARARYGAQGLTVGRMDALALGLADGSFDWVCSSHLIEHFDEPAGHVAEIARVLAPGGAAFFLTPNAPADFENPFHRHLFDRRELADLLGRYFEDVWVGGVDAVVSVKADFAARRRKAERLLALDVLDVRHRMPREWYIAAYTRLLPLAYRLVARRDSGGATGITAADWFVTEELDDTTLVLFGIGRRPL